VAEPRWNRSLIALVAAWVLVLAALAGAAGYIAVQRFGAGEPVASAPEEPRAGMVLELSPSQIPLANGGLVNGASQPIEAVAAEQTPAADADPAVEAPAASSDTPGSDAEPAAVVEEKADEAVREADGPDPASEEPASQDQASQDQASQDQAPQDQAPQDQAPQDQVLPEAPEQAPAQSATSTSELAANGSGDEAAATSQDEGPQGAAAQGAARPQQEAALPPSDEPPWRQFANDFDQSRPGPRVAIVLSGLGLSAAATEAAIKQLPPEITLSFSPYARLLNEWIALARANGHEVMLDLPMEPLSFPEDDPGPHALLTVLDEEQNQKRLDWLLRRGGSYVGVSAVMGSRFTASAEHMQPILESLQQRGLLFLDNRSSEESTATVLSGRIGLPLVVNNRTLDEAQASRVAINARLSEIERLARENGAAVAMAQPYPVTIERLRDWSAELESRGFVLAPVSALAAIPPELSAPEQSAPEQSAPEQSAPEQSAPEQPAPEQAAQ